MVKTDAKETGLPSPPPASQLYESVTCDAVNTMSDKRGGGGGFVSAHRSEGFSPPDRGSRAEQLSSWRQEPVLENVHITVVKGTECVRSQGQVYISGAHHQ